MSGRRWDVGEWKVKKKKKKKEKEKEKEKEKKRKRNTMLLQCSPLNAN